MALKIGKLTSVLTIITAVMLFAACTAFCDDAVMFSVTLPVNLPVEVESDGTVVTADNLTISNNASGPIAISSIAIEGRNGWTLSDYGSDYTSMPTDMKNFGMKIAEKEVSASGDADLSGIPFIGGGESFVLLYDATLAVQTKSITDEIIADVLITVGWQEGQLYAIDVIKPPDRTLYFVGENFDPTGMIIRATYYGGTSEVVDNYSIADGNSLAYGKAGVTIMYENEFGSSKSAVVPIEVSRRLTSLRIDQAPAKTIYNDGDTILPGGMVVSAIYENGESKVVKSYTVPDTKAVYGNNSFRVTYTENGITKELSVPVTVRRVLKSIEVTGLSQKLSYRHGESFDPDGCEVTATYKDGGTADVTDKVTWDKTLLEYTDTTAGCTYEENGVRVYDGISISVSRVLASIEITAMPTKLNYTDGDPFEPTGMTVRAVYTDGGYENISTYSVSPDVLNSGDDEVIIAYSYNGDTKTAAVPVTVAEKRQDISLCQARLLNDSYIYDGAEKKPEAEITCGDSILNKGTDYEITYLNNINPGTAKAVITGKGGYEGSIERTFSIKKLLTLKWSGLSYICNNEKHTPTVTIEGLLPGDAVTTSVAGKTAPGTYEIDSNLTFTSGNPSIYEIRNKTATLVINPGTYSPTILGGKLRTYLTNAGYDETSYKIIKTEIVSCYEPTGTEADISGRIMDAAETGDIRGYLVPLSSGGTNYKLVISGNGTGKIYCNSDSSYMFTSIVQSSSGETGSVTGLDILDVSNVEDASYMFSGVSAESLDISGFNFSSAADMSYWFYGAVIGRLKIVSSSVNGADLTGCFERASISSVLDIGGLDVTGVRSFKDCFSEAVIGGTVNLNAWNMSSAENLESMFERAKFTGGRLMVNAWDTSKVTTIASAFASVQGLSYVNISKWNLSLVKSMLYAFNQAQCSTVYINGPSTSVCSNFSNAFGGASSKVSMVCSPGDFNMTAVSSTTQKPFTSNKNYANNTTLKAQNCLKLTNNGGVIQYAAAFDD